VGEQLHALRWVKQFRDLRWVKRYLSGHLETWIGSPLRLSACLVKELAAALLGLHRHNDFRLLRVAGDREKRVRVQSSEKKRKECTPSLADCHDVRH
jgi:hypothetical protein